MTRAYTFRNINSSNLAWHPELAKGDGAKYYGSWLWLDGELEGGYQYSAGLFARTPTGAKLDIIPEKRDWPYIELTISDRNGKLYRESESYPPETFKPCPFGGVWRQNKLIGRLRPDGMPDSYELELSIGKIGLNLVAHTVATGVQFSEEEHGYSYYNPVRNLAMGWWPLVPRADVEGSLTIEGNTFRAKGLSYCERQLSNIPSTFGSGGQRMWFWGHFFAGDYTAVWTDSAASEHYNYRHFTPFVLWKRGDVILSTFNFSCCAEKFDVDPSTGRLYPKVETLRASDGMRELTAQLDSGKIIDSRALEGLPSASDKQGVYCRQFCVMRMQLKLWDKTEETFGTAIHEFGGGPDWFPFNRLSANV